MPLQLARKHAIGSTQRSKVCPAGSARRDQHHVDSLGQLVAMTPEYFAQTAPDLIANNRIAYLRRDGNAQPRHGPWVSECEGEQRLSRNLNALSLNAQKFLSPPQSQRLGKALTDACRASRCAQRHSPGYFLPAETARRFRPLSRRRFKTALPALVELRRRNPCVRLRLTFDGWYVRLDTCKAPSNVRLRAANSLKAQASQFPSTRQPLDRSLLRGTPCKINAKTVCKPRGRIDHKALWVLFSEPLICEKLWAGDLACAERSLFCFRHLLVMLDHPRGLC